MCLYLSLNERAVCFTKAIISLVRDNCLRKDTYNIIKLEKYPDIIHGTGT